MIIKIKRQDAPDTKPYWQEFLYEGDRNVSVAYILDYLNYHDDLYDRQKNPARRIRWECSCMQKMCGACAMRINHRPELACRFFLTDVKKDMLVLEPLKKFPVLCDLSVDRSIIAESLLEAHAYFKGAVKKDESDFLHRYSLGKCLKCGLCLEVCPNYIRGKSFFGALYANDAYFLSDVADVGDLEKQSYRKHFENGCSKSLACVKICPMSIPTLSSIGKMNS